MRRITEIFFMVLLYIIISCNTSKSSLIGVYVKKPSLNTKDTLFLYKNNQYKQVIYYKTGELFGINENTWKLNDGKIDFMNLYLNYDLDLNAYSKQKNNIIGKTLLIPSLLPYSDGKIILDKNRNIFYSKIKSK